MKLHVHEPASKQVQTVSRGLQVLHAFRSELNPLTNAELVRRTGLSKATVSRFTSTLWLLGYIHRVQGSTGFELSAAATGIGDAFLAQNKFLVRVRPFLRHLSDQLAVSTALAVPNGLDMLYLDYHAAEQVATLRLGPGSLLPMGMTAIGRAYLWGLQPLDRENMLARVKSHLALPQANVLDQGIQSSFQELDQSGVCCVANGHLRDTFGIALPVRLGRQGILMSMSCGNAVVGPNLTAERKRITPVLKEAAAELKYLMADTDGRP